MKAFLVFHGQPFEKTHNIQLLLELSTPFCTQFADLYDAAERLTPYATLYRYTGEPLGPSRQEFDSAFLAAESVFQAVQERLPAECQP